MKVAVKPSSRTGPERRVRALLVLAVAASLMVPAAISWACGPNRAVQTDRVTYSPGQTVNVSGANFDTGAAVDIKLNGGIVTSTTVSGSGNLSASFSAPSAAGTYTVTTSGVDQNGQALAGTGNAQTFSVVAPAASTPSDGGSGSSPGTTTPQRPDATAPGATSGAPNRQSGGGNRRSVSGGEGVRRAPANARRAPANAGVNTTEGVIGAGGTTSFAGSVPRATRVAVAQKADERRAAKSGGSQKAAAPSERSAGADLWSGLASGKNPSLLPTADSPSTGRTGFGLTLALALLGVGFLALLGLGIAEAQRRSRGRASAQSSRLP